MSRYGCITEIKEGVVFSDPRYDEKVCCQYRKNFTDKNFITEQDLFEQLTATFDGEEISKKSFLAGISENCLQNRVLLSSELKHVQSFTSNDKQGEKEQNNFLGEPER